MPKQQASTSSILQKIGNKATQAHAKAKDSKAVPKTGGELPGDVNGIAELVEVRLGEVEKEGPNKGKPYFYMEGRVVLPETHTNGVPIKGFRTSVMEMLFDTPDSASERKTFDQHWDYMYQLIRALGVDTSKLTTQNLDATFKAMVKARIHFRFHTWKPPMATSGRYANQETKVMHFWDGAVKFTPTAPASTAIAESVAPPPNGAPADTAKVSDRATQTATKAKPGTKKTPPTPTPPPAPEQESQGEEFNEFEDLDSLAEAADNQDEDAQAKLTGLAEAKGLTEEQIEAADDWKSLAALIAGGGEDDDTSGDEGSEEQAEDEPAEEEGPTVESGQMYKLEVTQPDPKNKKKTVKVVHEVIVQKVDEEARTANCLQMADRKTKYTGIPWDKLMPVE